MKTVKLSIDELESRFEMEAINPLAVTATAQAAAVCCQSYHCTIF